MAQVNTMKLKASNKQAGRKREDKWMNAVYILNAIQV